MSETRFADQPAHWLALKEQAISQLGPETVYGEGPLNASFALIGEAPGEQETIAKRPFIGQAGRLLDQLLREAAIERHEVYITNVVKVRPTTPGVGNRLRNRPPRAGEIREGLALLLPELALLAPKALILFGNSPAKALIGKQFAMNQHRGQWWQTQAGIPALATFHPAYLLRLTGPALEQTRALVLDDLRQASAALATAPEAKPLP